MRLSIVCLIVFALANLYPDQAELFLLHKPNALGFYAEIPGGSYTSYGIYTRDGYVIDTRIPAGQFIPFQIASYMFMHGGVLHLLFNMLTLISLGSVVERVIGTARFVALYLFCGLFAGAVLAFLDPSPAPVVGASGAIFGVFMAFGLLFPQAKMSFLFIPYGFPALRLVIGLGIISAVLFLIDTLYPGRTGVPISHLGHLAGMVGALVYIFWRRALRWLKLA